MAYSHRQTNENPVKKFKSNLNAKRSSLKPCNPKTSPLTADLLSNFLTFLQSKYLKYTSK
jgi:hypothetical protein